jgi:phage protein D
MQTPFYIVRIGDTDITNYISSFAFEDCTEEDDLMRISMPQIPVSLLDDNLLQAGKDIEFQFGYIGGVFSPLYVMRIDEIDVSYGKTIDINIKAFDYGQLLKKAQSKNVFVNKTASEIATSIAQTYGLSTAYIEKTATRYPSLAQGTKTDFEMLAYLASIEENGSIHWYIKSNALYFKRLKLEQESTKTFIYGVDVVSFKPSLKDAQNQPDTKTASFLDPLTKTNTNIEVDTTNAKDSRNLGKFTNSTSNAKEKAPSTPMYDRNGKVLKNK